MRENVLQPVQELIDAQLTFPLDRSRELGHQTGFSPNCREEGGMHSCSPNCRGK